MEETLINIDSKYRDTSVYPNESKFKINLEKTYKNVISIRIASLEMYNGVNYIDSKKNNNWIKVHLPNIACDPEGVKVQLADGYLQLIGAIQCIFNNKFNELFNTNGALESSTVAEKYFYFFYLNNSVTLNFDFNSPDLQPETIRKPLILNQGWYSVYGIHNIIKNYVTEKYNERKSFRQSNPGYSGPTINLDSANFVMYPFRLNIFDRRFRSVDTSTPNRKPKQYDCIRVDHISPTGPYLGYNLTESLNLLKNDLYKMYIYDINTFVSQPITSILPVSQMGILDKLTSNNYIVPSGAPYFYANGGSNLLSASKYHINNESSEPNTDNIQVYNLLMEVDRVSNIISFTNDLTATTTTNYYYYWTDPLGSQAGTWDNGDKNKISNLLKKSFLKDNIFISPQEYYGVSYNADLKKDIPVFDINFNTYSENIQPMLNGILDLGKLNYPSVGYYLGFRPIITRPINKFVLSSTPDSTLSTLRATRYFETRGETYIFIKINDWGYIDFFNRKVFAKVILPDMGNTRLDDGFDIEYRFRQPQTIQKLEFELIDYLGNLVNLNGHNFSLTLELKQIVNSDQKNAYEKQNLVFIK